MTEPLFSKIGVLYVEHMTVPTKDLIKTLTNYLSIPNSMLIFGPLSNSINETKVALVELNNNSKVEIVSFPDGCFNHLEKSDDILPSSFMSYVVENLKDAIDIAVNDFNSEVIYEHQVDDIMGGRNFSILYNSEYGFYKLSEAYPSNIVLDVKSIDTGNIDSLQQRRLIDIYKNIVDKSISDSIPLSNISMKNSSNWDSFSHLLLIMEIEKEFEVSISADTIPNLDSLVKIDSFLREY